MKEENRKETFKWAFKFTAKKFISIKIGKEIKDCLHHLCPCSYPVLQYITNAYLHICIFCIFHCPNMVNNITVNKSCQIFSKGEVNIIQ